MDFVSLNIFLFDSVGNCPLQLKWSISYYFYHMHSLRQRKQSLSWALWLSLSVPISSVRMSMGVYWDERLTECFGVCTWKKKRLELLCHKIHHFKVYNSVGFFGVFRSLCHHDHYLILILFITPRRSSTPFGCHILIPCQTLAHFCLWSFLCLFWTVHLNGILQYVAFHVWLLLSLSIMFPLFIPVY